MDFKLKDLGKIKKADIKLDGITVICGDNNTGKSTIGKSLFSFYNALYDYKTKISMQKDSRFKNFILSNINSMDVPVRSLTMIAQCPLSLLRLKIFLLKM